MRFKVTESEYLAWTKDGKGFFYSGYEKPAPGAEFQALNYNNKLFYHHLGTPQPFDRLAEQPARKYVTEPERLLGVQQYDIQVTA